MMCVKKMSSLVLFFAIVVSGCTEQNSQVALPKPRPLGQGYSTFKPAAKLAETSAVPEIADPTGVITLRQSLALALLHNPELKAYSWNVRAYEAGQLQAGLWANPVLGVEVEDVGGTGETSGFDGAETTIQLSQLIEMGGKRDKRIKVASLDKKIAGWDYEAKRLDVFTEVTKAFVEVLAAQQRLGLTKELLGLSQELLDAVSKRVDAGKDSPLEKTKAAVILSNIRIQHQQAIEDMGFAKSQLASMWASSEAKFKSAAGDFKTFSQVPSIGKLKEMLLQNPDFQRWTAQVDKSRASLEFEKSKAVSDITIKGGMKRSSETNDNSVVFGILIPLPVSDRNQGGRMRAIYVLAKARELQRAARTKIQMDLARAHRELSKAYTQASELSSNVLGGAESVFQASKIAYREGKLDYLHVLDAQRILFEARGQYIGALASYHSARADVERLVGQSIDSNEFSINNEEVK